VPWPPRFSAPFCILGPIFEKSTRCVVFFISLNFADLGLWRQYLARPIHLPGKATPAIRLHNPMNLCQLRPIGKPS
jgi:hypothetical protein